ncbi:hypothetical protein [Nocardia sp. NPDC058497]|uniref:DUF7373 family lipoprotein n=1 Tax=Nocardia sp. NPDC058497 TaxID=3346529 RepID=UPI0036624726
MRFGLSRVAVPAVLLVSVLVACGDESVGPDYGPYSTARIPADYDAGLSNGRGILVESLRLGERVSFADQIDPDLTSTGSGGVLVDHRGLVPGRNILSGAQSAAAGKHDILGAFGVFADNGQAADKDAKFVSISLLAFPSEDIARTAVAEMARADFEQNPGNQPLVLPEYPGALTHWYPSVPTVGSWLTWKSLVIRVYAKVLEPRADLLSEVVAKTYRTQLADLAGFTPTPQADLAALRIDPDGLLARVVQTGEAELDDKTFAVYGPRALALMMSRPSKALATFRAASVSQIAVAHDHYLRRTGSPEIAAAEADRLTREGNEDYLAMPGIESLPTVSCWKAKFPLRGSHKASRFKCIVYRGVDLALVYSYLESDVRHLAAAQYALLAQDR